MKRVSRITCCSKDGVLFTPPSQYESSTTSRSRCDHFLVNAALPFVAALRFLRLNLREVSATVGVGFLLGVVAECEFFPGVTAEWTAVVGVVEFGLFFFGKLSSERYRFCFIVLVLDRVVVVEGGSESGRRWSGGRFEAGVDVKLEKECVAVDHFGAEGALWHRSPSLSAAPPPSRRSIHSKPKSRRVAGTGKMQTRLSFLLTAFSPLLHSNNGRCRSPHSLHRSHARRSETDRLVSRQKPQRHRFPQRNTRGRHALSVAAGSAPTQLPHRQDFR